MLIDDTQRTVTDSASILGFEGDGGNKGTIWYRYLTVDGRKAYQLGNVCGTCAFYFERLDGATRGISPEQVAAELNNGITSLDPGLINALEQIMPSGEYQVLLQEVRPRLVTPGQQGDYFCEEQAALFEIDKFWGFPFFPKTEYYRVGTRSLGDQRGLFEFLIPIYPHGWLDADRLQQYDLLMAKGASPTAVAIGVLDVKQPAFWEGEPAITSHWCLAQYLVDGHHKTYAAAKRESTLSLLTFLALEQGVSSEADVRELVQFLARV